jgi:hypothetical protein
MEKLNMDNPQFLMRWPELDKQVRVEPINHNQKLFDWFVENLPTSCLQTHTVVAGYSLFMLNLPMKKTFSWRQEDLPIEDIKLMPKGRFTFFMTVGKVANLSCKWGEVTEPMSYITWAEVVDEDKPILFEVGKKIWEIAMSSTKEIVHVEFVLPGEKPRKWHDLKAIIDAENERIRLLPPEEVVKVVHYRIVDTRAGTDNQALSNWFFSANDIRYVAAYLYNIIRLAMDDKYTTAQIKTMAKTMLAQPAEFAGYSGFHKIWEFTKPVLDVLDEVEDRNDVLDLLNSLYLYASNLNAWIHHYFPWKINYLFPHRNPEEIAEMVKYVKKD